MNESQSLETLLLIPLEDSVVFPNMSVTLPLDPGEEERVFLVPQRDGEFADVGTVAEVVERVRLPGGATAVGLFGLHRGRAGAAETGSDGRLRVQVEPHPDETGTNQRIRELDREYRAVVEEILELRDATRVAEFLRSITEPGPLADTAGYSPDLTFDQKVELLETLDVEERLRRAVELQRERLAELQIRRSNWRCVQSGGRESTTRWKSLARPIGGSLRRWAPAPRPAILAYVS